MSDQLRFDEFLRSLDPKAVERVIASLKAFEDEFRPEHVTTGVTVLLNLMPSIPDRPRGMFDFGPKVVVGLVIYRMLRSVAEPDQLEVTVRTVYPQLTTLSAKLELIETVGHRENVGHNWLAKLWRQSWKSAGEPMSVQPTSQTC
jgi:hypothetical protein